jgi:hypothetical protein
VAPGRWQLLLEAQPWRSGVALQSTGTLQVRGDVAGTSARLQPAQVLLHWDKVSLADLFRLITGNDPGVRGEFALDANANVGKESSGETAEEGQWRYELRARARRVHRWDLTERSDNPRINLHLKGLWSLAMEEVRVEQLGIELPRSNFNGTAVYRTSVPGSWSFQMDSAAIQAQDLLAWYRAFHPGVAEGVSVEQFFIGDFAASGWPMRWKAAHLESNGGLLRVPGFDQVLTISPVHGEFRNEQVSIDPVHVSQGALKTEPSVARKPGKSVAKSKPAPELQNAVELRFLEDAQADKGALEVDARLDHVENFFKAASAFGQTLNHGWELTGGVGTALEWSWDHGPARGRWDGSVSFLNAQLQAAGLNQPLKLNDARLERKGERLGATLARAEAFGATWSGTISEDSARNSSAGRNWQFQLHADHLDAAELDRWFGPRARPNWFQRLLPSLLGNSNSETKPSELLRRVSAEGELSADLVTIEKLKLMRAHAEILLRNLRLEVRDADAQWAGGSVHGELQAIFSPAPEYQVTAEIDRVSLAQLPWAARWADRWSGSASGKIRLTTAGVGREELLRQLNGLGDLKLKSVEFRGWDVPTTLESGTVRTGVSRWTSGEGEFAVKDRTLSFDSIRLEAPEANLQFAGTVSFGQNAKLTFAQAKSGKRSPKIAVQAHVLQVNGPLDSPQVAMQPGTEARPKP